jgi:hypothetical protein
LFRALGPSRDSQFGTDIGAQYGPFLSDRLTLGATLRNALSFKQGDTDDRLAASLRAGAAWRVAGPLILAADASSAGELGIGTEYAFGMMTLRAGYASGGLSFGGGVVIKKSLTMDLAVANSPTLGMSQRLAVGWRFSDRGPAKLSYLAQEYMADAIAELANRNYVKAGADFEAAAAIEPGLGGKEWKRKAARLRDLIVALGLNDASPENDDLRAASDAALLAHRAIMAWLEGRRQDAVLLATVCAGSADRNTVFMRLLEVVAKEAGQRYLDEDVVDAEAFKQMRLARAAQAILGGRYEAAVAACREVLVVAPEDPNAWSRLGSAYFASGAKAKAVEAYQKALQYAPGNEKLRQFLETVR